MVKMTLILLSDQFSAEALKLRGKLKTNVSMGGFFTEVYFSKCFFFILFLWLGNEYVKCYPSFFLSFFLALH